jgi:hypothetical protein
VGHDDYHAHDGKALRGADRITSKQVSLLNVLANDIGIVIKQLPTKKGAGEKATALDFAKSAEDLEVTCVMGDAMLTDKKLVDVLEKKPSTYSLSRRINRALEAAK